MPPRSAEEKARRKAEALKRKEERQQKKAAQAEADAAKANADSADKAKNSSEKKSNELSTSLLLDLPEDALKQVLCCLPAACIGRVSMTCRRMNQALPDIREAYLLARLRKATIGSLGTSINMCDDLEQASQLVTDSFGGGDTGRIISKKAKHQKSADEFVAYARFVEEAVHGYVRLGFRAENEKARALAPRVVNGRFVSVSPEHSLCRGGGDGQKSGAGGSGVASFGVGKRGQLGHGKREDEKAPKLLIGRIGYGIRIVQVSAGGGLVRVAHSLLLTSNGRVLSFGTGQYGALGHGYSAAKQLPDVLRPQYIEALSHIKCICVSAGELHSAAVSIDGDTYTWGDGFCGQLGHGDKRPSVVPKQVEQGGLEDECIVTISCGSRHTLAVTEEGEAWSWGLGHFGALGRSFTPFEYDADAAVVALGGEEAAIPVAAAQDERGPAPGGGNGGLLDNEELRAHLDLISNLSLDDSSDQCIPMVIDSLQTVKILGASAGHRHSLVLDANGGVYAFGSGRSGCLGTSSFESEMFPVRIKEFVDLGVRIHRISAGVDISMAVSTTGQAYSWGATKGGRIGQGMLSTHISVPRRLHISDSEGKELKVVDVDCGYVHSLVVALNGTIYECGGVGVDGRNDGQLAQEGEEASANRENDGQPRVIPDYNIWHRVPEPKEHVKKEKWKKYGKYEVKGRAKMMSEP